MQQFTPFEKLSKKKQRAMNLKKRKAWTMNPVTRKPKNPKAYQRKRIRKDEDDPFFPDSFL